MLQKNLSMSVKCEWGEKCGILQPVVNPSSCWCITCTSLGTIGWLYCHKCRCVLDKDSGRHWTPDDSRSKKQENFNLKKIYCNNS